MLPEPRRLALLGGGCLIDELLVDDPLLVVPLLVVPLLVAPLLVGLILVAADDVLGGISFRLYFHIVMCWGTPTTSSSSSS